MSINDFELYICGNCGHNASRDSFTLIPYEAGRFEPGDIFSDRECPFCGAIALPQDACSTDSALSTISQQNWRCSEFLDAIDAGEPEPGVTVEVDRQDAVGDESYRSVIAGALEVDASLIPAVQHVELVENDLSLRTQHVVLDREGVASLVAEMRKKVEHDYVAA